MFDNINDKWIDVPLNTSVLWCGSAAEELSKGKIKVGWHRVLPTEKKR